MELVDTIKGNFGTLAVGALWMIYVLGDKVLADNRDRRKAKGNDEAESSLIKNLTSALAEANKNSNDERTRADGFSKQVSDFSIRIGQLEAKLEYAETGKTKAEEEVEELQETVEMLVIENRNKDKSITELVGLNRKILRTMGSPIPSLPLEADDTQPEDV